MIDFAVLGDAVLAMLDARILGFVIVGMVVGIAIGAMPGLSATPGVALMLPLTFSLDIAASLGLLMGIYKGAVYGGSISAISFAIPGTPEAAATVIDGHKLNRAGHGRKALLTALYASVTGDLISTVATILIAPTLALIAFKMGPSERFWLMVIALTLLISLGGREMGKGFLAAGIGIFLASIGTDPIGSVPRNTFGQWWLVDGIDLVPLTIGLFAIGNMLYEGALLLAERRAKRGEPILLQGVGRMSGALTFREYLSCWKEMSIGTVIGTIVGILPGLGSTVGAFVSYAVAQQASPQKRIGTGRIEGVAAAESGNNATVGPALVPLLSFGIPGSTTAALIGGAMIIHGVTPSPRMFEMHADVIYRLFAILIMTNIALLVIGRLISFPYARLGQLPREILVPLVFVLAIVGTYAYEGNLFHVVVLLGAGLLGFLIRIVAIPEGPLVIAFLITPLAEGAFRRALLIHRGDLLEALFPGLLAIFLAGFALLSVLVSLRYRVQGLGD